MILDFAGVCAEEPEEDAIDALYSAWSMRQLAAAVITRALLDVGLTVGKSAGISQTPKDQRKHARIWIFANKMGPGSFYHWASILSNKPSAFVNETRRAVKAHDKKNDTTLEIFRTHNDEKVLINE